MNNYSKRQIQKYRILKILFYTLSFLIALRLFVIYSMPIVPTMLLLLVFTLFFLADIAGEKQKPFTKGLKGEQLIEDILKHIPNISAYKDLVIGDSNFNIDFVVVSKSGIFVIEVKNYSGKISANGDNWYQFVNGKRKVVTSFTKQAKSNAFKFREYLTSQLPEYKIPYIAPVVVLVKPFSREDIRGQGLECKIISPEEISQLVNGNSRIQDDLLNAIIINLNTVSERIS